MDKSASLDVGAALRRSTLSLATMIPQRSFIALLIPILGIAAVLCASVGYSWEGGWTPKLRGRVNDTAIILSISERRRLSEMLRAYEQETHHQIVVLTIETLGDEPIESFSLRTANSWHLGLKGVDNGILVTLAMKERKVRIELGKGMERFISDAQAKLIIDTQMTPAFSKGKFSDGLERGLNQLMGEARLFVVTIKAVPTTLTPGAVPAH